jgi:uncharacterized protein YigE (DUF2233 family)
MINKLIPCLLFLLFITIANAQSEFIDFKVDNTKNDLELRLLDKSGNLLGSFERLEKELDNEGKELLFAMNGGIFMQNQMPLGLYIENSKIYRKLNTKKNLYGNFYLQPNGVFLIADDKAYILESSLVKEFVEKYKVQYATQSGPMLLINGAPNHSLDKHRKKVIRNAICIDSKNTVILSISKKPVNFFELYKHLLKDNGCSSALYLDGGISNSYKKGDRLVESGPYGPLIAVTKAKQR